MVCPEIISTVVLCVAGLAYSLSFDVTIVNNTLLNSTNWFWPTNANTLKVFSFGFYGIGLIFTGFVANKVIGRTIFIAGLLLSGFCSLATSYVDSIPTLLVFEALNIMIVTLGWNALVRIVSKSYSERFYPLVYILYQGFSELGRVICATTLDVGDWRLVFVTKGFVCFVMSFFLLFLYKLQETQKQQTLDQFDDSDEHAEIIYPDSDSNNYIPFEFEEDSKVDDFSNLPIISSQPKCYAYYIGQRHFWLILVSTIMLVTVSNVKHWIQVYDQQASFWMDIGINAALIMGLFYNYSNKRLEILACVTMSLLTIGCLLGLFVCAQLETRDVSMVSAFSGILGFSVTLIAFIPICVYATQSGYKNFTSVYGFCMGCAYLYSMGFQIWALYLTNWGPFFAALMGNALIGSCALLYYKYTMLRRDPLIF